jgi:hypothetical protein
MRLVHQPGQPAGAIEQRILGVQMQMNKVRVWHGPTPLPDTDCTQERDALENAGQGNESGRAA